MKSIIRQNAEANPDYTPYCLRCTGLVRMQKVEAMLWRCRCGAVHDERECVYVPIALRGESKRLAEAFFGGATVKTKIICPLVGENGNAFAILGRWQRAARKAGLPKEEIDAVLKEAKSGDYDHLLATIMQHSEEPEDGDDDEEDE